jgi:hypothetical protein
MKQRIFSTCGMSAPLVFAFMTVLGGAMRPGYSHIADTVSELLSPGSPHRLLLAVLFTTYAVLIILFGIGMFLFIRSSEQSTWIGSLGASMLAVAGLVSVAIATVFPQDPWGSTPSFAGEMHMMLTGAIGGLQTLSISLLGIWFHRGGISPGLAVFSFLTAGGVTLSAVYFLMMAGTPLMGFAERIPIFLGLMWTLLVARWMGSSANSRV